MKTSPFYLLITYAFLSAPSLSNDVPALDSKSLTGSQNTQREKKIEPQIVFKEYPWQKVISSSALSLGERHQQKWSQAERLRNNEYVTKIDWKGVESITPYILKGPNYHHIEVVMDFDHDEFTNDFFHALLNLQPSILTIINNSKGVAKNFNLESITTHVNFDHLNELNFCYCYKLQPFFENSFIANKIRKLTWGALDDTNIWEAIPQELARYSTISEFNFGGVLVSSKVMERLKEVLSNKTDMKVFIGDFIGGTLEQWLDIFPPTESLEMLEVSGLYSHDTVVDKEFWVYVTQQEKLVSLSISNCFFEKEKEFADMFIKYLQIAQNLKQIYIADLRLSLTQWSAFGFELTKLRKLQCLSLTSTNMDDHAAFDMALPLKTALWLKRLTFDKTEITSKGLETLLSSLASKQLDFFSVNDCKYIQDPSLSLCQLAGGQNMLQEVWLQNIPFSPKHIIAFIQERNGIDHPVSFYMGSQTFQETYPTECVQLILEGIQKETLLPEGGMVTIYTFPAGSKIVSQGSQNFLIFSNKTRARVAFYYNPLTPIIPIPADDPQARIPQGASSTKSTITSPGYGYSWYNPMWIIYG